MDPDRLVEGDPPLDALAFCEVTAEVALKARQEAIAARDMMRPYALRALLDGADPVHVAGICGFEVEATRPREQASDFNRMYAVFMSGPEPEDPMRDFKRWLWECIEELVA